VDLIDCFDTPVVASTSTPAPSVPQFDAFAPSVPNHGTSGSNFDPFQTHSHPVATPSYTVPSFDPFAPSHQPPSVPSAGQNVIHGSFNNNMPNANFTPNFNTNYSVASGVPPTPAQTSSYNAEADFGDFEGAHNSNPTSSKSSSASNNKWAEFGGLVDLSSISKNADQEKIKANEKANSYSTSFAGIDGLSNQSMVSHTFF